MTDKIRQLLADRAKLIKDARSILDAADEEKRDLTSEEEESYRTILSDAGELKKRADRETELMEAERTLEGPADPAGLQPGQDPGPDPQHRNTQMPERAMDLFRSCLQSEDAGEFRNFLKEYRALQGDQLSAGGALVPPEQFVRDLIKFVDDRVYIRTWATVVPVTSGANLGVPSLDTDPADADWTSEIGTGNEDTAMKFGKRELSPSPLAKRIKVSKTLLRKSALSVDQIVRERLGYKFAVSEEKAFLVGTESNQPLGVFTADANGISTGRDVSTDNETTAPTFDGLKEAKYTLKSPYRQGNGRWLAHRDFYKLVSKIKDGEGRYIWEPSTRQGDPDRLLGLPSFESEFSPNTFTTGKYVAILGDFRAGYWIADSLSMDLQVLTELYAETNQNGYIGRMELDGMPVLEEAFVRVKLA